MANRDNLERLLRSAWQRQIAVRVVMVKGTKKTEIHSFESRGALLWRCCEVVAVIIGLIATLEVTELLPWMYWFGVVAVYAGSLGLIAQSIRGRTDNAAQRIIYGVIGFVSIVVWTVGVVCASVPVSVDAKLGTDNTVQVYIENRSDYNLTGMDLTVSIGGALIQNISQVSATCQDFSYFPDDREVYETSEGNELPSGPSSANRARVICRELPNHSLDRIVISVRTTGMGKDPQNPFPQNLYSDTKPTGCFVKVEYRALGKTRSLIGDFKF